MSTVDALFDRLVSEAIAVRQGLAPDRPDDPAVHEAGHAIVGIALGGRVRSVTITDPPEGARGHCRVSIPVRLPYAAIRVGAVAWAGGLATGSLLRSNRDLNEIVALFGTLVGSLPAFRLAARAVAANGELIDEVAAMLRQRGTITGAELHAMYEPPDEVAAMLRG